MLIDCHVNCTTSWNTTSIWNGNWTPNNGKFGYIFGVCGVDQSVHLSYKCIAMKESDTEMSEMIT